MVDTESKQTAVPVTAATILLVRDSDDGVEVLMVKRHHEIEFAAGALVFPGGKTTRGDFDPALAGFMDGASDWADEMRALCATAIREAFEEAGVLLARDAESRELVSEERLAALDPYREKIEKGEISLVALLQHEGLRLAGDALVPFAHWITPRHMKKRFDTRFFLARVPAGHAGRHCGRESVDSFWLRPQDAIINRQALKVMFPTRQNLMKLAQATNVDEALAFARSTSPLPVEPWIESGPDGKFLRIRDDAGYELTRVLLRDG